MKTSCSNRLRELRRKGKKILRFKTNYSFICDPKQVKKTEMSNNPYSKHNVYSPYTTPTYYSRSRNHHQQQQQQQQQQHPPNQHPKKIHINPNFSSSTASSTTTSGALDNDSEAPIYVNVSNPSSSASSRVIVNPKVIHPNITTISSPTFFVISVPISFLF